MADAAAAKLLDALEGAPSFKYMVVDPVVRRCVPAGAVIRLKNERELAMLGMILASTAGQDVDTRFRPLAARMEVAISGAELSAKLRDAGVAAAEADGAADALAAAASPKATVACVVLPAAEDGGGGARLWRRTLAASFAFGAECDAKYCTERGGGRAAAMPAFAWTGALRPAPITPYRPVPRHIPRPDYADTGYPEEEQTSKYQHTPPVLNAKQIEGMRRAGRLGREVLDAAHRAVGVGVTTDEIDRVVHEAAVEAGAYPAPLRYFDFPKSVCTSVNEVVCHGIPDKRELQDGDTVNVDVTVILDGFHGDLNETFCVGKVDDEKKRLIKNTYECLDKAIKTVKPGLRFRDIGTTISSHARKNGHSVVKSYCGHGIGELFHCAPNIPHYAKNKAKGVARPGMCFTIEPMINAGGWRDTHWPDGWTAVTSDGLPSAQFEHTLVVTQTGCDVLTKRLDSSPPLCFQE